MTTAKPSLSMLRELSDEAVLRALMAAPRMTRAELAVATDLSKPTATESIRRLETTGLVRDTGERTHGRGGVGSYYSLAPDVGVAIAVSIAPSGIVVECVRPDGSTGETHVEATGRPATPRTVARLLTKAVRAVVRDASDVRVAVVSAADPVDRHTGSLVHLPDAPFLLGRLSPAHTLAPLVGGAVLVDNDVNWAARAERAARTTTLDDFVYLHLGEGLGAAVVSDGEVRRGHHGLAGEIAHVTVTGVDGRATAFTEVFAQLGLRHAGTAAIDVAKLLATESAAIDTVAAAVGDVITSAIGFGDPSVVVVGGDWGPASHVFSAVRARAARLPRTVPLSPAEARGNASLDGARAAAVVALQDDIVARTRTQQA